MKLPNKAYDIVKYTTLVAIPAASTAYMGLDAALDGALPYENQVVKSLAVLALLLGSLTGITAKQYNNSENRYDGEIEVNAHDPSLLHSLNLDGIEPRKLGSVKEVTLKVTKNEAEPPPPEID